ncbi:hypothetical protein V3C99_000834 [Haemonchus contortus]
MERQRLDVVRRLAGSQNGRRAIQSVAGVIVSTCRRTPTTKLRGLLMTAKTTISTSVKRNLVTRPNTARSS